MSVTVHQILNDAKRLVSRLREHDSTADSIISQTQTLYKNVESMKEYNEDVSDQNLANRVRGGGGGRPLLVFNVAQENRHIRELQQENRELREALEEHQSVLELIMSKYRQQVTGLVGAGGTRDAGGNYRRSTQELQKMADSICEFAEVMKKSIKMDDQNHVTEQEKLTELITENRGLLELLEISKVYGSLQSPLNGPEMVDKEIQTDT